MLTIRSHVFDDEAMEWSPKDINNVGVVELR